MHFYANGDGLPWSLTCKTYIPTAKDAARRLLMALQSLLKGTDNHKQASGLLVNKDSLLREARQKLVFADKQTEIGF